MNQDPDKVEKYGLFLIGGALAFIVPVLQVFH